MSMLWYKSWLETRARFLICLVGSTALGGAFVHHIQQQALPDTKVVYYYASLFHGHQYVVGVWVLASILLAMGGLVREGAAGSSSFTLALPVTRRNHTCTRIVVGLMQMLLLAVVPWAAICAVTVAAGNPLIWTQASYYLALLLGGGLVYFSISILISSVIEKEFTAPTAALGVVILSSMIPGIFPSLRPYSVLQLMSGSGVLDKQTYLLAAPFPWLSVLVCLAIAGLLLWAAVVIVEKREF